MVQPLIKRFWHFWTRIDLVSWLIFFTLILVALGSFFPQLSSEFKANPGAYQHWQESIQTRYGGWVSFLAALNVFEVYRSGYFVLLLVILTSSTLICTLDRWGTIWRRVFQKKFRWSNVAYESSPFKAEISGVRLADFQYLQKTLDGSDYRIKIIKDDREISLRAERNRFTPLTTLFTHLGIILLLLGVIQGGFFGWRENLSISSIEPSVLNRMDGLLVGLDDFTIERYRNGSVSDYEASIYLLDAGSRLDRSLRLNQPVQYRGMSIYLDGFREDGQGYVVSLLAVHDPGFYTVLFAGLLLLMSMTVGFNFSHKLVFARLEQENTLHLFGVADHRSYDFEKEFQELVKKVCESLTDEVKA